MADVLKRHFQRASDLVARYGGEEFCVVLPDMELNEVKAISEQLRKEFIQRDIKHQGSPIADCVTISVGIVTCQPDKRYDAEILIQAADKALYEAKNHGRNRVEAVELQGIG